MPPKGHVAQEINKDLLEIAMQPHLGKWFAGPPKKRKKCTTNATSPEPGTAQDRSKSPDLQVPSVDKSNDDTVVVVKNGQSEDYDKAEVALSMTGIDVIAASDDTNAVAEEDDEDEDVRPNKKPKAALVEITAYVDVVPPSRTPKAKEVTITCGPFLFTVETMHDDFLQGIVSCATSNGQSHSITSINQSQLYWKFNVPLNDKKKPLSTAVGYQALVSSVKTRLQDSKGKSKDNSITLTMPPLSKKLANISNNGDNEEEEFKLGPAGSTIREQQACFPLSLVIGQAHASTIERLRQKYLVGTDPRFPDKRVYCALDKRVWELNNIRLTVWAQAIDNGVTSFDAPPNSTHFSDSQKLRSHSNMPEVPAPPSINLPPHTQGPGFPPHIPNFPGFPPYYSPYAPLPYSYYPPYYHQPPPDASSVAHPHAPASLFHGPRVEAPIPAPGSPQQIVLSRVVPLAEFCHHYKIDDEDQARLAKLRFLPGNRRVEKLGREDWHDHTGFERLAWEDFLDKHRVFLRDVKAGSWI